MDPKHIYRHSWSFMWANKRTLGLYSLQMAILLMLHVTCNNSQLPGSADYFLLFLDYFMIVAVVGLILSIGIRFDRAILLGEPLPHNLLPDLLSRRVWLMLGNVTLITALTFLLALSFNYVPITYDPLLLVLYVVFTSLYSYLRPFILLTCYV